MSDGRPARRPLRDALVVVGIALVLIAVLEGVARLAEEPSGPHPFAQADAYDGVDWAEDYFAEFVTRQSRWEPLTYWRIRTIDGAFITVDSSGIRATPGFDAPAGLEVWMFGGSTMWGSGARDAHTIPSELGRELARRGIRARVVNLGESGYVSTQERIALVQRLAAGERPDLVVLYDGYNDLFAGFQAGRGGVPMNESRRVEDFEFLRVPPVERRLGRTLLQRVLRRSALWRTVREIGRRPAEPSARFDALAAPYDAADRETIRGDVCRAYKANVEVVRVLGEAYGFEVLAAWQPALFSKRVQSPSEEAFVAESGALAELYDGFATLCDEAMADDPSFANVSGVLDDVAEPLYFDTVHVVEEGNRLVAEALADTLAARGVLDRLAR